MQLKFKIYLFFLLFVYSYNAQAQKIYGKTIHNNNRTAIEYVNIGVVNKNIGTVSDQNGKFAIELSPEFDNDTLKFSCIGYQSYTIKVADFEKLKNFDIALVEKTFQLTELTVKPRKYVQKIQGVTSKSKKIATGFTENRLGYECGVIISNKKSAKPEKLFLNIASCSYDTVFFRVNFYSVDDDDDYTNILQKPIYFQFAKNEIKDQIEVDLTPYKLYIEGDYLVTIEQVRDFGEGYLYFCAGMSRKTHYRRTSQGLWDTAPIGISLSIQAQVEK